MELETTRLKLREMRFEDAKVLHTYSLDPEFRQYENNPMTLRDFEDIAKWMSDMKRHMKRSTYYFTLTPPHSPDIAMGSVYVAIRDEDHQQAEVGYILGKPYWGKGYMTEAVKAVIDFAFTHMPIHRLYAECISENQGSVRVLQKVGMRQEAHLRHTHYFSGRWWDTYIFALLADEWHNRQNTNATLNQIER